MRVLVGCESSGVMREAFNEIPGVTAFSCDLQPPDDGRTDRHIQADILDVLKNVDVGWDLFLVHPSCQFLTVSGMHWTTRGLRDPRLTINAIEFAEKVWDANIPHIVLENPISVLSTRSKLGKPSQIIQPYEFGEDASKKTCLWLKRLQPLRINPADFVNPRMVCKCKAVYTHENLSCPKCGASVSHAKPRWSNQTDSGQNKLAPSKDRWKKRSRTYPGIARAMAQQFTQQIKNKTP